MKILCFGDSLTRGVTFLNGRLKILKNNYPKFLQELFQENNISNNKNHITVINKGAFNDNTSLLISRLHKDVIQEKPDYVIIEIGGNDCDFPWSEVAQNPNSLHEPTIPLDKYIHNLKTMIERIREEGITPILSTLPPLDPVRYYNRITENVSSQVSNWICKVGGIEHWHGLYNRSIKKVAAELEIRIIDVRSAIKRAGDLQTLISDDGIHLTEKGYMAFANEVFRSLNPIIHTKLNEKYKTEC